MTLVNRVFDSSPAQVFQAFVQGKQMSWAGRGGPHYYLTLQPWGPVNRTVTVGVSSDAYYRASNGSAVCISLHTGALGVSWYYVGDC